MAVMGRLFLPRGGREGAARDARRVVEPELDMQRAAHTRPSAILGRIGALVRWMMPAGRPIAPPMRSIDRELWEISSER